MIDPNLSNVDLILVTTKAETAMSSLIQKTCWERCVDTLHGDGTQESLSAPALNCVDRCASKLVDTAMRVSLEQQLWQMQMMRKQSIQNLTSKVMWGIGATTLAVAVGTCLLKGE
eukprot:CAMPEP_0169268078 /NCGR_PEP_ID=MMETSP1016-20121227/47569_1 /TAXON_ID=342587 /ORGANISM="Karlodinium micrum, Strain CCMP2283" /LENGTH=114 /DNA_ID=CAMNT_0009352687 /DNA_START=11 /DNA_END=355 /DNA_ORIENTATION=+